MRNVCGTGTTVSSRFSVNSSNHSGKSRNGSCDARLSSFFLFWFWVFGESRKFPGAGSSLRSVAGLEDVLDESCGGDVEDELVPEFDDNPRTARGSSSLVWSGVAFDRWPTHRYIRVLRRGPSDKTAGVSSSTCTVMK